MLVANAYDSKDIYVWSQYMKEKHMIVVMVVVLLMLTIRLFSNKKQQQTVSVNGDEFNSTDELAVFVTLENEIAIHNQLIQEDVESKKTPEYSSRYPNLYAVPKTEWDQIEEEKKICYLTFDDGPSENTLQVLDTLDKYKIKAVFFVIGSEVLLDEKNQEILKEVSERGHLIALHTYSHDYKKIYASVDAFLDDYEKVFNVIEELTGQRPYIFRFPGGSYNSCVKYIRRDIITEMKRRGFIYYDWNVSGEDSVGHPSKYTILKNIKRDLNRYHLPVVLLHDGQANKITANSLEDIIKYIQEQGYEFGRLDERTPCQFRW